LALPQALLIELSVLCIGEWIIGTPLQYTLDPTLETDLCVGSGSSGISPLVEEMIDGSRALPEE